MDGGIVIGSAAIHLIAINKKFQIRSCCLEFFSIMEGLFLDIFCQSFGNWFPHKFIYDDKGTFFSCEKYKWNVTSKNQKENWSENIGLPVTFGTHTNKDIFINSVAKEECSQ